MAIEFICPHCDKLLRTADDKAGARANCPHCRQPIDVPEVAEVDDLVADDPLGDFFGSSAGPGAASPTNRPPQEARCPACQARSPAGSRVCRHCGATIPDPSAATAARFSSAGAPLKSHRGVLILTLAILGWFAFGCVPLSFSAALLGTHDLRAMREGRMDPSGETMTQVGQVMGFIQLGLFALSIVFIVIMALVNA